MRFALRLIAVMAIGTAALVAQQLMDTVTTAANDLQRAGFTFGASAFSSYTSWNVDAILALNTGIPTGTAPNYFATTGVSLTLGWQKRVSEDSVFNVFYSPYYAYEGNGIHSTSYTSLSPLRGTIALNWSHKLGHNWNLGLSGSAVAGNFGQTAFLPSGSQSLASFSGSPSDLGGLLLAGQGVGGSSAVLTPQQALLFGDTFLSSSANVSLAYSASPRVSISGDFSATYMRHLNDGANQSPYLLNQATSGSVAMTINYSIAPRTSLFANATYSEPFSSLERSENGLAFVGFSRALTEHFFARVSGGAGYTASQDRLDKYAYHGTRTMFSLSGGYRLFANTFILSTSKSLSDYYGIGTSSIAVTGGWTWRKPGSDWGLQAGASEFWLQDGILASSGNLSNGGFIANAAVYHMISHQARISLQYVYSSASLFTPYLSAVTGPPVHYSLQALRLSISWSPRWGRAGSGVALPADFQTPIP